MAKGTSKFVLFLSFFFLVSTALAGVAGGPLAAAEPGGGASELTAPEPAPPDETGNAPGATGGAPEADRDHWIGKQMPTWLREEVLFCELWQWIGLGIIILLGLVLDRIFVFILNLLVRRALLRVQVELESKFTFNTLRPFGHLVMALVWVLGIQAIGLPGGFEGILLVAAKFIAILSGVWGAYRLVDIFTQAMAQKAARTETRFDDLLVPLVRKTLKVFIGAFGLVFIADNLHDNLDISSLLAGLGIGGLAFALAAQDTVKNLFGLLTIVTDRPFQVGDWVLIDGTEGTVEAVGFRSTRLRTFWNSRITVPNSKLLTAAVDNMGMRAYRRYRSVLSLTYDTDPERIEAFCEGVRELIRQHPYTRKDYYHVYFHTYAAASLDVLVYMFFEAPDWGTELRERERFNLDILRLAKRLNVDFAFPTQTLHLYREEGSSHPALAGDLQKIISSSRQEARDIVKRGLGKLGAKPDPVVIKLPE